MRGKLLIACVVALASVPTAASASTAELTYPTGTRLATGNTLKGVNTGSITFKTAGGALLWECTTASMTGTLVKNNGTEVEANVEALTMTGTAAESKCTSGEVTGNKKVTLGVAQGLPWCLKATSTMKEDEFQIRGGKCSEASRQINFGLDDALGECKYKRGEAIAGTFTTEPSDAVLSVPASEFVKESGSIGCTTAYRIEFSLTLERDEEGTHPVYLS
ncbi:MAG TPA: hypothetical protein VFJ76_03630 [Solirubrobacterales bacterium]|nr:hypothetical protein [Solirubrobacterales bacterium]